MTRQDLITVAVMAVLVAACWLLNPSENGDVGDPSMRGAHVSQHY